jgi:trimethylamine--corrinoid protein Co-methyltransferase
MKKIEAILNFRPEFPANEIIDQASELLFRTGIWIEDTETRRLLLDAGARALPGTANKISLSRGLIESCLETTPDRVTLFDRDGQGMLEIGGKNMAFVPGSAALNVFDWPSQQQRLAVTTDLIQLNQLVQHLPHFQAQATSIVPSDVPEAIADSYRLYLALGLNSKPIVTGLFQHGSFETMFQLLQTLRRDAKHLREQPLAIFDCCPVSPLKWGPVSCQTIFACARAGIPVELVPMPLPGATAPVSLYQTLVQYLAEILSGVVIGQLAQPSAPIIAGAAPAIFDLRTANPAIGAVESLLLAAGYAKLTKTLNLPTHAYLGLTDSQFPDAQAGYETGTGLLLAALSDVNLVAGGGMLACINAYSPEKLVLDHDFCGQILRFRQGIAIRADDLPSPFSDEIQRSDYFLTAPATLEFFREELALDYQVIDRNNDRKFTIAERAHNWLKSRPRIGNPVSVEIAGELTKIMKHASNYAGLNKLPYTL